MCVCVSGFDWWHDTIPNFYFVNIVFAKNDNKDYYYYNYFKGHEEKNVIQLFAEHYKYQIYDLSTSILESYFFVHIHLRV